MMQFLGFGKKSTAVDPVCGMDVEPKKAAATYEHQGKTYYFCAPGCKVAFSKAPEKYLQGGPTGMGGMSTGHH